MRKAIPLLLVALILSACSVSFGPQRTPEDAYRLKISEFKAQADAIQLRIILGLAEHDGGEDGAKWADVPAAIDDFNALLADARLIEPPIIDQNAHRGMTATIEQFALAMERLTQYVATGRQDRYNDFKFQMRGGNSSLTHLADAVPPPD